MQQVNLYSEILRQEQQQSGIQLFTLSMVAVALLFILFSAYVLWDIKTSQAELQQAQLTVNQQQTLVDGLMTKKISQGPNSELMKEIQTWQNNVNEAAQTLQTLANRSSVLSKGFSNYLKTFAINANPDVWLTGIHINGNKAGVKLEGSTFIPQQIPNTLQQLQNTPALKGLTFAKLTMQQSTKVPGQMDFVLSSSENNPDDQGHDQ
jgi:Tfp pilus assembly protein PilN